MKNSKQDQPANNLTEQQLKTAATVVAIIASLLTIAQKLIELLH